jgi:hypothetical protein
MYGVGRAGKVSEKQKPENGIAGRSRRRTVCLNKGVVSFVD